MYSFLFSHTHILPSYLCIKWVIFLFHHHTLISVTPPQSVDPQPRLTAVPSPLLCNHLAPLQTMLSTMPGGRKTAIWIGLGLSQGRDSTRASQPLDPPWHGPQINLAWMATRSLMCKCAGWLPWVLCVWEEWLPGDYFVCVCINLDVTYRKWAMDVLSCLHIYLWLNLTLKLWTLLAHTTSCIYLQDKSSWCYSVSISTLIQLSLKLMDIPCTHHLHL